MKLRNTLGLAMAAIIAMGLMGCDSENPEETAKDEADIDANTRAAMNKDDAELKEELAKAQAKDPSIKDMYYGVDDDGNKVLHVIREQLDAYKLYPGYREDVYWCAVSKIPHSVVEDA